MKRKQIQILLILSAVAAALAILLAVLSREPAMPETRLLLQSSAPLSTICYTNKDGTVRLEQENGVWRLSGDSAFPVSQQAAQTLAQALLTAPIEQAITPVADASAQYGLEQPQCEIELAFEDGAQHRKSDQYILCTQQRGLLFHQIDKHTRAVCLNCGGWKALFVLPCVQFDFHSSTSRFPFAGV